MDTMDPYPFIHYKSMSHTWRGRSTAAPFPWWLCWSSPGRCTARSNGEIHRMWICCVLGGKEILSKLLVLQNLLSHLSTENMEATASNCKQPQV